MSSRKEEERNEKIIRGLLKLPPNRRCINCNSLGPQYVCTNFRTFVCTTCSGIHREFTHRVKSVSMAKFTTQEVDALQRGGNQRAREQFLNDWDIQRMRLPDNSNPDKIREFIKNVYVDKKFAGGRSSDKPPRDTQTLKGEEDHRRASSYHSFSQSPPYDHQYEERRYGRQAGMLTRKPGSDHGHYEGKLSSFIYSPGRQVEQMDEDRFANEGSGSRMSDYSVSSIGDPFRSDAQSPNFQVGGYSSPPLHASDIITEDMRPWNLSKSKSDVTEDTNRIPKAHRSASAGSFGSIDSNPISLKSANSSSLIDSVLEPDHTSGMQRAVTSTISSSHMSSAAHPTNSGLFNKKVAQSQSTSLTPPVDLFANFSQPSLVPPLEQKSASGIQQADTSTIASSQMSWAAHATNRDLFNQPVAQSQISSLAAPIDLFADFSQPSVLPLVEQKSEAVFLSGNEGWATFDLSHRTEPSEANIGIPPMASGEKGDLMRNIDLFPSMPNNSDWYSVQNTENRGPSSLVDGQWSVGFNEQETSDLRSLMPWNAFDDLTGKLPQTLPGITSQNSISQDLSCRPPASVDSYIGFQAPQAPEVLYIYIDMQTTTFLKKYILLLFLKISICVLVPKLCTGCAQVQFTNVFLSSTMDDKTPAVATLLGTHGSNFSPSALPQMGGVSQERKAANPFDLPFDSDTEANNMFMDMSSLQTTLPDPQSPSTYLGGLPDPWFSQNSLASFIPSIPQGGLSYIGGQVPRAQMQNVPSQGPVASLGGNPFA